MISIKKLATLSHGTAIRKSIVLLQGFEMDLKADRGIDKRYVKNLFVLLHSFGELDSDARRHIADCVNELDLQLDTDGMIRICNGVRHRMLKQMGDEPADWDLVDTGEGAVTGTRMELPMTVYLDDIRSPFNVGAIFRSAESFGGSEIILSEACPSPEHPRALRSSMGCTRIVPWRIESLSVLKDVEGVFALETGGDPVETFAFPVSGIAIIGNEELGISPQARELAAKSAGRVSIPTYGCKGSLNVSSAFSIMVHAWFSRLRD